jgi:hypothetical protein
VARLLPSDFDITVLEKSEQRVCQALLTGLDDSWFVVPQVPVVAEGTDGEIDIVLVSAEHGVLAVEVKGGVIRIEKGKWFSYDNPMKRSPAQQAVRNKHLLLKRLRSARVDTDGLFMGHVIALPDVGSVPPEGLGTDAPSEIVFAKTSLAHPTEAVTALLRAHTPVPVDRFERFLAALRPDIVLDGSEGRVLQAARSRLDDETRVHLAGLEGLDANQRVLVTGGAGTGKTMLAIRWARRAVQRGERTLVVCFNKPIAERTRKLLEDSGATVSTFHDVLVQLLEPHGFRIGANPTPEYWRNALTEALAFHADRVGTPFDTIVVDEGQDFYAHWFEALQHLLDPRGPQRLLVVADPAQAIYVQPWAPPPKMVTMPLVYNLRNCGSIAKVVQRLGGPTPLPKAPFGDAVRHFEAGGHGEVRAHVRAALHRLCEEYGVPFSQIAVLTTRTEIRNQLLDEPPEGFPLARWEHRSEDNVLCETVQRTKGLERTAIVLVDLSGTPDPVLVYVGASRAVSSLSLVGPPSLAHAVGVPVGGGGSPSRRRA